MISDNSGRMQRRSALCLATAAGSTIKLWEDHTDATGAPAAHRSASGGTSPSSGSGDRAYSELASFPFAIPLAQTSKSLSVNAIAWSRGKGELAVCGPDGFIAVFNTQGKCMEVIPSVRPTAAQAFGEIRSVKFATNNRHLVFAGSKKLVYVWDRKDKKIAEALKGHVGGINCVALNVDEAYIASASESGEVRVYNRQMATSQNLQLATNQAINTLEFSWFRRGMLAAAGDDGKVYLWDVAVSPAPFATFSNSHSAPVTALAFSPMNKNCLASAGLDKRLILYDVAKKSVIKPIKADGLLSTLAFKDGITLAAGTTDGRVLIHNFRAGARATLTFMAHDKHPVKSMSFQKPDQAQMRSFPAASRSKPGSIQSAKPPAPSTTMKPPAAVWDSGTPHSDETRSDEGGKRPALESALEVGVSNTQQDNLMAAATPARSSGDTQPDAIPSVAPARSHAAGGMDYMDMFSPVHMSVKRPSQARKSECEPPPTYRGIQLNHESDGSARARHQPDTIAVTTSTTAADRQMMKKISLSDVSGTSRKMNSSLAAWPLDSSRPPSTAASQGSYGSGALEEAPYARSRMKGEDNGGEPESYRQREQADVAADEILRRSTAHEKDLRRSLLRNLSDASGIRRTVSFRGGFGGGMEARVLPTAEKIVGSRGKADLEEAEKAPATPPNWDAEVDMPTFQQRVLENVIDDCLEEFRRSLRNDIRDMHLELLRQFHLQRNEIECLLQRFCDRRALEEEVNQLREENRLLKMR